MHKAILMILLAVVSSSVMAEWILYGYGNKKEVEITVYADPATIRKSGNTVKM